MKKIRVGIVGLGVMGMHHARVISEEADFELVAIMDPAVETLSYGNAKVYRELKAFLELDLDYCILSVPTLLHNEYFKQLCESISCILVEKPLAMDLTQAEEMIQLAKQHGNLVGVGHIERFNPAVQLMKQLVSNGQIGDLLQISTRRQGPNPQRILDVGVAKDLATHDIDITQWVTGSNYARLSAETRKLTDSPHEDLLSSSGLLASGVIFNHIVNWRYPIKERVVSILGTKGALVADLLTSDLTFFENGTVPTTWGQISLLRGNSEGSSFKFAIEKIEPLRLQHRSMASYFRTGNQEGTVTIEQGAENLRIAEKMIQVATSS